MRSGIVWFLVGLALVWGSFRWWSGSSAPSFPKGPSYMERVEAAKQEHMDHVGDALWRQATAFGGSVPLALDNQSGMDVYVKVVSLDIENAMTAVNVLKGSVVQVECPVGRFFLKMRYESEQGYSYQKGDDFSLTSGISTKITLHKVVMGNYGSSPMAASDF